MKGTIQKVRTSKYRHLFGEPWPSTECMNSAKVGTLQIEANPLKANSSFLAYSGGVNGTIVVIPTSYKGAILAEAPTFVIEEDTINELAFNPFDDHMIVSGQNKGDISLWKIPEGGLTADVSTPLSSFHAHDKRILNVDFHPLASNILLSADSAGELKVWDIQSQTTKVSFAPLATTITNFSWNKDGSLVAVSSKDKKLRIQDVRSNKTVGQTEDNPGAKGSRVAWLGSRDKILSVGFSKTSDRQYQLFDPRNFSKALVTQTIDQTSSTLMPFYDDDLGILYLAGKGDANIRFYEVVDEDPLIHFLGEFKSKDAQTGLALLPKRVVDTKKCEVVRFLKLTTAGHIIPLRFSVPRQDFGIFQEDIYPDTFDGKPALSADEWFSGANKTGGKVSMNPEKK